jgi:hypothetical protein
LKPVDILIIDKKNNKIIKKNIIWVSGHMG